MKRRLALAITLVLLAACPAAPNQPTKPTLYQRVGEIDGLRPVVDELVWRLAADDVIAPSLAEANFEALKKQMLLFLCARSGGPCLEGGDRPLIAMADSDIDVAIARLVELAAASAQARDISEAESLELSELIAADSGSIIGPPR